MTEMTGRQLKKPEMITTVEICADRERYVSTVGAATKNMKLITPWFEYYYEMVRKNPVA